MESSPAPAPSSASPGLVRAIAVAALVAGTCDYTAATTQFLLSGGKDPVRIAWYIASAVLGRDAAYAGGWLTAALGVALHYLIATIWTVFFFLLYPRFGWLQKNPFANALGYGIFVWAVMNRVVVPLSRITPGPFVLTNALIAAGILVVCIGLPIALLARRHYAIHSGG